jgi:hypothetical protein
MQQVWWNSSPLELYEDGDWGGEEDQVVVVIGLNMLTMGHLLLRSLLHWCCGF